MKRKLRIPALILIFVMLLSAAFVFADGEESTDDAAASEEVSEEEDKAPEGTLRLLYSGGIHSHLESIPLARTAYLQQKETCDSVFLADAGDFSMGTPFQTVFTTHASELRTLAAAGWDVVTLGCSEFGLGASGLTSMLGKAMKDDKVVLPELVVSNVEWTFAPDGSEPSDETAHLKAAFEEYGAVNYTVISRGGISVAFFGIMSGGPEGDAASGAPMFAEPVAAAKRVVSEIKEKEEVDLVVCLLSGGSGNEDLIYDRAKALAKGAGGIDVIVCSGTARIPEPEGNGGTLIVSTGVNSEYLGFLELNVNGDSPEVTDCGLIPLIEKPQETEEETSEEEAAQEETDAASEGEAGETEEETAQPEPAEDDEEVKMPAFIDADFKGFDQDKAVYDRVVGFKAAVDKDFFSYYGYNWEKVLAESDITFTDAEDLGRKPGEDTLGDLVADSVIYAVREAEGQDYQPLSAAIVSADVFKGSFGPGEIDCGNVLEALPLGAGQDGRMGYPLVSFWLTGEELKYLAEADVTSYKDDDLPGFYFSGLEFSWNPHRLIYDRAYQIHLRNEEGDITEIDEHELYRVAADIHTAGLLASIGTETKGLLKVVPRDAKGQPLEDMNGQIVYSPYSEEIKAWYALASYMDSFEDGKIPGQYRSAQGRKELVDSRSPLEFLRSPNKFFFVVSAFIILVLILVYLAVRLIVRFAVRRKRMRAGEETGAAAVSTASGENGEIKEASADEPARGQDVPSGEAEGSPDAAEADAAEEKVDESGSPEETEEAPEEEGPAKPLWSEIFTPVEFNWDTGEDNIDGSMPAAPEPENVPEEDTFLTAVNSPGGEESEGAPESERMTPFGPAPDRAEEDDDLSLVKSLFADMGDLGSDVVGAVAPNVEPEEPAFEHLDFDWFQEIEEPAAAPEEVPAEYELAPEDRIKEGEKVFDRAVKIDDEKELAALLSAEQLLDEKVSKLKENKKSGNSGKKAKKYHISDRKKKK